MAQPDEILIEQAKNLTELAKFMEAKGDSLTKKEAHEIATLIKSNAESLAKLAKIV